MDLKDFVKETMSSIIDAVDDLQSQYSETDNEINPPRHSANAETLYDDSGHAFKRVQVVAFDVAVSVSNETSGEGGAKIKVFSVDVGGKASGAKASEQVSRVRFEIPLSLTPGRSYLANTGRRERARQQRPQVARSKI